MAAFDVARSGQGNWSVLQMLELEVLELLVGEHLVTLHTLAAHATESLKNQYKSRAYDRIGVLILFRYHDTFHPIYDRVS